MDGDAPWTLDELSARVRVALESGDYVPPGSNRVRAVPDRRTIRYYTTLGLVDRPELRGRTAHYGRRHLQQLVAIKRLQAEGLKLNEVQARLAGLSPRALAEVADLPPAPAAKAETERAGDFWAAVPAAAPPPPPAAAPAARALTGLTLAEGVTLLLEGRPALSDEDLRALRRAAAPLLRELRSRGTLESGGDPQEEWL